MREPFSRGDHALDWTGPREAISHQNPLANYVRLLFEAAKEKDADTVELTLDQEKSLIRTQLGGPGAWQQVGGLPEYTWSSLLFTCLEIAAIESCQGTIQDPASGAEWRFTFRKEGNQIRLSRMAVGGTVCR